MSDPRRKLTISVPELPWERRQRENEEAKPQADLRIWEEACKTAALRSFQQETRWAGTD